MSEYVGEAKVRIVPDASGFGAELRAQVGQQASTVGAGRATVNQFLSEVRASRQRADALMADARRVDQANQRVAASSRSSLVAFGVLGFAVRGLTQDFGQWAQAQDGVVAGLGKIATGVASLDLATIGQGIGESVGATQLSIQDVIAFKEAKQREESLSKQEELNELAKQYLDLKEKAAEAEGEIGTAAGRTKFELEQQLRVVKAQLDRADPQQRRNAFGITSGTGDFGASRAGTGAPGGPTDADFGLKTLRAQLTKTQSDDLALYRERAQFLRGLIGRLEESGANTKASKANLQRLYGQLLTAQGQITSIEEQIAAAKAEALQASIQISQTNLQIQSANARTDSQSIAALQAEVAFASGLAQNKELSAQEQAGYALQAAEANKQIFGIQEAQREEARRLAEEEARQAEALRRENEAKLQRQKDAYRQLVELRLSNAEAVAQLTKSTADDKKAIRKQIAYWKSRVAELTGLEREQARSELISARSRLKGLSTTSAGGSAADFFKQAISDFRTFGSNFSSTGGGLSPQAARGQFAGLALGNASNAQLEKAYRQESNRLARIRTSESLKQTKYLGVIAGVTAGTGLKLPTNKIPGVGASVAVGLAGAVVHGS